MTLWAVSYRRKRRPQRLYLQCICSFAAQALRRFSMRQPHIVDDVIKCPSIPDTHTSPNNWIHQCIARSRCVGLVLPGAGGGLKGAQCICSFAAQVLRTILMGQSHIDDGVNNCPSIPDTNIPEQLDTSVHSELLMCGACPTRSRRRPQRSAVCLHPSGAASAQKHFAS